MSMYMYLYHGCNILTNQIALLEVYKSLIYTPLVGCNILTNQIALLEVYKSLIHLL